MSFCKAGAAKILSALHGVEILGRAEVIGDVPRTAAPDACLMEVERSYARKYAAARPISRGRGRGLWL
jgi:hypothetical protein